MRLVFVFPPPGVEAALLSIVLAAAVFDVRYRRIPNWLSVTGVVVGLSMNWVLGMGWRGLRFALTGMAVAFGIYLVLYILHAMGAGDVKLMAAVGSLVGWQDWMGIFFTTAIVGGIMAVILVLAKKRFKKTMANVGTILTEAGHGRPAHLKNEELDVRSPKALSLPHGAVIAIGTLFFLALSGYYLQ